MSDIEIEKLKMIHLFQANATARSFYLLVKKGVISIEEYNGMLSEARVALISAFKDLPSSEINLIELVNFAFDGHFIPEDMNEDWIPSFSIN